MADSVYNSRKVLAVISENYLASKFCRQELDMALYRSVSVAANPSLLLIRVDDVDKKKLPKSLQKQTFLDYTSAMERNKWEERLLKHIDISFVAGERWKSSGKWNFYWPVAYILVLYYESHLHVDPP